MVPEQQTAALGNSPSLPHCSRNSISHSFARPRFVAVHDGASWWRHEWVLVGADAGGAAMGAGAGGAGDRCAVAVLALVRSLAELVAVVQLVARCLWRMLQQLWRIAASSCGCGGGAAGAVVRAGCGGVVVGKRCSCHGRSCRLVLQYAAGAGEIVGQTCTITRRVWVPKRRY